MACQIEEFIKKYLTYYFSLKEKMRASLKEKMRAEKKETWNI